ncbi:MAG: beta-lactamase family protein [Gammaproteobacteria bacterium]|nr:beta-lactamase family protein [Gammaproteobacteria bacterium]
MRRLFLRTAAIVFALPVAAATADNDRSAADGSADHREVVLLINNIAQIREQSGVAAVGLALVRGADVLYSGGFGVLDLEYSDATTEAKTPAKHSVKSRPAVPAAVAIAANTATATTKEVPGEITRQIKGNTTHKNIGETVTADTLFRVGSITKSFTGLTALRLARHHKGLLQLQATAVIDNVVQDPFNETPVTLQALLEHTAGLNDLSQAEFDVQDADITFAEALNVSPRTRVLKWAANRHSSYSNAGYGIAGYMLEKVTHKRYEELVHEQLLAPLNMNASGFYLAAGGPPLAVGYNSDGVSRLPYWHMIYRSFAGLNSTPRDMARFLSALLTAGTGDSTWLTKAERQRFENPQTTLAARTGLDYGYGLGNYHWFRKGARFHGHGGDADGYLSHYAYNHESGLGYFVVITAFKHPVLRAMRDELEDFIAGHTSPVTAPTHPLEPAQLKQWTGQYAPVTQRFGGAPAGAATLEIRLVNGQLETRHEDIQHALIAVSERHFRREWQPQATYAFIVDGDDTYLQGDLGNFKKIGTRGR